MNIANHYGPLTMTFDSAAALRQLLELQQQIIDVPRIAAMLQVCAEHVPGGIPRSEHTDPITVTNARIAAALNAERHINALVISAVRLRAQVAPFDRPGDEDQSLSELVLRVVRLIALTELDVLKAVLVASAPELRARTLCWGRFDDVTELTDRVRARLGQIANTWMTARGVAATDRVAYRAALRAAHAATRHLGSDSAFGTFLREAGTRSEWPALQATCTRMRDALVLRIDIDVDMPLIVHSESLADRPAEKAS